MSRDSLEAVAATFMGMVICILLAILFYFFYEYMSR
jgi:hypothetical protein